MVLTNRTSVVRIALVEFETKMDVAPLRQGRIYELNSTSGSTYEVGLVDETYTCPDHRNTKTPGLCDTDDRSLSIVRREYQLRRQRLGQCRISCVWLSNLPLWLPPMSSSPLMARHSRTRHSATHPQRTISD